MPVFFAPWFLAAGLAAAVPVALHLLHRRRPHLVQFSTVRFLTEAVAKTRRSRRLTQLLALLLRVLILLILALAFARPRIRAASWLPEGQRTVLIVLDASASMRYVETGESVFDRARGWAKELVDDLSSGDQAAVLTPGGKETELIFPPVSDHKAVQEALEEVKAGYGEEGAFAALRDVLEQDKLPADKSLEVHVFSDFQQSSLDGNTVKQVCDRLEKRSAHLFLNRVAPATPVNAGIEEVRVKPPAITGGGRIEVSARVRRSSAFTEGGSLRVYLQGRKVAHAGFSVGEKSTVKRRLKATVSPGRRDFVKGRVVLPEDPLGADNTCFFCLPRVSEVPVLVVGNSRDTAFLRHAVRSVGGANGVFRVNTVSWRRFKGMDADRFPILYLCNPARLTSAVVSKLRDYMKAGGHVVLFPGDRETLAEGVKNFRKLKDVVCRRKVLDEARRVDLASHTAAPRLEKAVTRVLSGNNGFLLRRRLNIRQLPAGVDAVLQYPDGAPFLVMTPYRPQRGRLYIVSVSANRDWSDWPLTPFFVVLQKVLLREVSRAEHPPVSVRVGGSYPLSTGTEEKSLDVGFVAPDGEQKERTFQRANPANPFALEGFDQPGFYRVLYGDKKRPIAVNLTPEEMKLAYTGNDRLANLVNDQMPLHQAGSWEELRREMQTLREGRPLWPLLLVAAFFLALMEELFANVRSWSSGVPPRLRQLLSRPAQQT